MYNLLTDNGARSRTMKKSSTTLALTVAAAKGYVNVLRKLVDEGADISVKCGEHNETPLHFAARAGKTQVVAFLLERGANIERPDGQSRVPLHCAACNGLWLRLDNRSNMTFAVSTRAHTDAIG